jgi:hypothetical protein
VSDPASDVRTLKIALSSSGDEGMFAIVISEIYQ